MPYEGRYANNRRGADKQEGKTGALGQFLDNHIRLIAALSTVIVLILAVTLVGWMTDVDGFGTVKDDYDGKAMTVNYLNGLSEKTARLSWKDFDGISYAEISEDRSDEGTYVLRRYEVEGGGLSVSVGGYIKGDGYTGYVEYATVTHAENFDFSFSLLGDGDLLSYLESFE